MTAKKKKKTPAQLAKERRRVKARAKKTATKLDRALGGRPVREPATCSTTYDKFRGSLTWDEAQQAASLRHDRNILERNDYSQPPRRAAILGMMREAKLADWDEHQRLCDRYGDVDELDAYFETLARERDEAEAMQNPPRLPATVGKFKRADRALPTGGSIVVYKRQRPTWILEIWPFAGAIQVVLRKRVKVGKSHHSDMVAADRKFSGRDDEARAIAAALGIMADVDAKRFRPDPDSTLAMHEGGTLPPSPFAAADRRAKLRGQLKLGLGNPAGESPSAALQALEVATDRVLGAWYDLDERKPADAAVADALTEAYPPSYRASLEDMSGEIANWRRHVAGAEAVAVGRGRSNPGKAPPLAWLGKSGTKARKRKRGGAEQWGPWEDLGDEWRPWLGVEPPLDLRSRQSIVRWLQWNDKNADHLDALSDSGPMSMEWARWLYRDAIGEDPGPEPSDANPPRGRKKGRRRKSKSNCPKAASKPNPGQTKRKKRSVREVRNSRGRWVKHPGTFYPVPGVPQLAVARELVNRKGKTAAGDAWTVVHKLSGMRLPASFKTKSAALKSLANAGRKVPDVPWRWADWDKASDWTRGQVAKFAREVARGR